MVYSAAVKHPINSPSISLASYQYNYLRQRTRKTTPQGIIVYHYDLQGHLIQETDVTGKALRTYVWADDMPLAQYTLQLDPRSLPGTHGNGKAKGAQAVQAHRPPMPEQSNRPGATSTSGSGNETLVYLHTDHLGTPRLATDQNGTKVWSWEGEAFGNTTPDEDPDGDGKKTTISFRHPGQYFDAETGLLYNWNRYYDPKLGRYITSDPIGLEGGLNTYAYALNNPLYWIDPNGLDVHVLPSFFPTGNTTYPRWFCTTNSWGIPNKCFSGSTEPDKSRPKCDKGCPEILPGTYPYKVENFPYDPSVPDDKKYPAPRLGTVPTRGPNPNNGNKNSMTGAWMHKGANDQKTGSEGCLTLQPKYWDDFMRNVGSSGNAIIW